MKPFRASIELTVAAPDLAAATTKWDELQRCGEDLGFHLEGGAVGLMDSEDVIAASPLARQLEQSHNDTPCGAGSEG